MSLKCAYFLNVELRFLFKESGSLSGLLISSLNSFWLMEWTPQSSTIIPTASVLLGVEKNIHKWYWFILFILQSFICISCLVSSWSEIKDIHCNPPTLLDQPEPSILGPEKRKKGLIKGNSRQQRKFQKTFFLYRKIIPYIACSFSSKVINSESI